MKTDKQCKMFDMKAFSPDLSEREEREKHIKDCQLCKNKKELIDHLNSVVGHHKFELNEHHRLNIAEALKHLPKVSTHKMLYRYSAVAALIIILVFLTYIIPKNSVVLENNANLALIPIALEKKKPIKGLIWEDKLGIKKISIKINRFNVRKHKLKTDKGYLCRIRKHYQLTKFKIIRLQRKIHQI